MHRPALDDLCVAVDEHTTLHVALLTRPEQSMPRPDLPPQRYSVSIYFFACSQTAARKASSLPPYQRATASGTSFSAVVFSVSASASLKARPSLWEKTAVISYFTGSSATSRT